MGGRLLRFLTWKVMLYLLVAIVICGLTRDRALTGLLTMGFAAGDASVAVLLNRVSQRKADRRRPVREPDHSSAP